MTLQPKHNQPQEVLKPPATAKQPTFAEVEKTNKVQSTRSRNKTLPQRETTILHPTTIKRFKKFGVMIRHKLGKPKPFQQKNLLKIINSINRILLKISFKTRDTPIQIQAVTQLPLGDICVFKRTRAEAKRLLTQRNLCTHLAELLFITTPSTIPISSHYCPTVLNLEDTNRISGVVFHTFLDQI
ncbi:hypothetical protein O181_031099 [Austropuccinia psidii MF-1]|uniref:Uncharacterized protein n=1 Tax=Austropuccinia psidii MF-1 TaxID=1389203 RepID=A0A9Q3CU67_9BASI|nr:hypothetical protein [Austropuccinia psidii MF-1]